jgi:hypothetical protein
MAEPDEEALLRLEAALPTAPDGTYFVYGNAFRWPHCAAAFIDFAAIRVSARRHITDCTWPMRDGSTTIHLPLSNSLAHLCRVSSGSFANPDDIGSEGDPARLEG